MFKKVMVGLACCGILLFVSLFGFGYVVDNDGTENAGDSFWRGSPLPNARMQINVMTGNMWLKQIDYQTTGGLGGPLDLQRFYNTVIQTDGLFGKGWRTQFDVSLEAHGDLMLQVNMLDGRTVYLGRKDTTSAYTFSPHRHLIGSVTKKPDGSYLLKLKDELKDGREFKFTSSGRLDWKTDRNGKQVTLTYDANGNLTKVVDGFGRSLNFTMSSGRVTRVSDAFGKVADYAYNADGTLQSVTYVTTLRYQFEYTSINNKKYITAVKVAMKGAFNNTLEAYQYDKQGRVTKVRKVGGYGGGEKLKIDYEGHRNYQNNPYTTVTDALGHITRYNFKKDAKSRLKYILSIEGDCDCGSGEEKTTYEYDDNWNVVKKTDALGNATTYTHDADGNVLTATDALGTLTNTYNSFGQVLTATDRMVRP